MVISLIGYMGSGKSHISNVLAKKTGFKLTDLDREISLKNKMSISEIFQNKGELYFRKEEHALLEEIFTRKENFIFSLGGGTPAYYDNMQLINNFSESVFLRTSIKHLAERLLRQKEKRPLIASIPDRDLKEFIAKHLFERNPYYSKAKHIIDTDNKSPEEIADEILSIIPF